MRAILVMGRHFLRTPVAYGIVTLLVTLVVAGNASIFSVYWSLTGKPLPYRADAQLVELRIDLIDIGMQVGLAPRLQQALDNAGSPFETLSGFPNEPESLRDSGGQPWSVHPISSNFTELLGVEPLLGQGLSGYPRSLTASGARALVIAYSVWQRTYAGDPGVLGRQLRLDDENYQIVGVLPATFGFPSSAISAWTPYQASAADLELDKNGAFGVYTVVGRLRAGASLDAARAQLGAVLRADPALAKMDPQGDRGRADVRRWRERFGGEQLASLRMLQWTALLLLLVVAASLANFGLDHALARQREFATRQALGSTLTRLRLAALAGVLPAIVPGLVLGLLLVPLGIELMRQQNLLPPGWPLQPGLDGATVAVALMSALALLAAGVSLAMRTTVLTGGRSARGRALVGALGGGQRLILVGQIGLSLALAGSAGLLLRSAQQLLATDTGFDARGVVISSVDLGAIIEPEGRQAALMALISELRAQPGVSAVAVADMPPFSKAEFLAKVRPPGASDDQEVSAPSVGADYFAALGMPVIMGRSFAASDASVVVIDQEFRRRWFADRDPIGASVQIREDDGGLRSAQIIGVVPDVKHRSLDEAERRPTLYQLAVDPGASFFLVSRTQADLGSLARAIAASMSRLLPNATLSINQPLEARIDGTLQSRLALLKAVSAFAATCLLVAGLAIYAVLSITVRRRSADLGLRLALGATRAGLFALVLREGRQLLLFSLPLGCLLGLLLARQLSDQLYHVHTYDPWAWGLSALALTLGVLTACWAPAHAAMRIEPAVALKGD